MMNTSRLCVRILHKLKFQKQITNCRNIRTCQYFLLENRQISSIETQGIHKDESLVKKVLKKFPFFNVNRTKIMSSAYFLYEGIADRVNYLDFFQKLDLPDTFYSWFVVTELHIWMISARGMAEGEEGRLLRNFLVEALWNDVAQRIKQLGGDSNPSVAREQVAQLSEQLQAALIAYDEGLQGDDTILAGALWRRFYQQADVEPQHLEMLVKYVRKQMRLLDHLSHDMLLETKKIDWIQLES